MFEFDRTVGIIQEPTTAATDLALALVSGVAGALLLRAAAGQTSRGAWGAALLALAIAAALGGVHHGFALQTLWTPTALMIGIVSAGMLAGSAFAAARGLARRGVLLFALVELAAFTLWMLGHDSYGWVIADSAAALGGAAVSALAAAVQAARIAPHPAFNHNDLYHVIQIGALLLFYQGARLMVDRR